MLMSSDSAQHFLISFSFALLQISAGQESSPLFCGCLTLANTLHHSVLFVPPPPLSGGLCSMQLYITTFFPPFFKEENGNLRHQNLATGEVTIS
jgi:hypothetical protein